MQNKKLDLEDNAIAFYAKCAKLNVPVTVDPQFLKRVLRSSVKSPFESFVNKVHSNEDIEHIRNVLVAHKMKEINKNSIKNSNPNSLPEELRRYLEHQQCREQIKAFQSNNIRSKENEVLERLKKNVLLKRAAESELSLKQSRIDILQAMSKKLDDEIVREEEIAAKIDSIQPVLSGTEEATAKIHKTFEVLKEFNAKGVSTEVAKEYCFKEVEKSMYNIPNSLIYETIVNAILKSKVEDPLFDELTTKKVQIQNELLEKFQELKIKLGFKLMDGKRNVQDLKEKCAVKIQQVESQLELLLDGSMIYYEEDDDDIVGEFVSALIAKLIQEGKMKLLQEKLRALKSQPETFSTYEKLVHDIQESNQLIGEKVNDIQSNIAQAHLINEKIKFSFMKLMRTVNNLKLEKHQQTNRTMLNRTVSSHLIEKQVESGAMQEEFELFLASCLKGEERVDLKLEQLLASSYISQTFSQDLVLFMKSLKNLHDAMQLAQTCAIDDPRIHHYVMSSDFLEALEKHHATNRTEIRELFDKIARRNVNIKVLLANVRTVVKFIQENSLKKFIDPNQKVENKSYLDYEKEYMMYYKMIKN